MRYLRVESFAGILAPTGTPAPAVDYLRVSIAKMLARDDVREAWIKQGATVIESAAAQFEALIAEDIARWTRVVRESGVKLN